jgi:ABC-type phosphate/phosphonate transport system permease subunit
MELLASSHGEPWQAAMIGYLLSFYSMAFAALVAMPLARLPARCKARSVIDFAAHLDGGCHASQ